MGRVVAVVLLACVVGADEKAGWATSLEEAKSAARKTRRPVLCLVAETGDKHTDALVRMLRKNPVKAQLAGFQLVRLERSKHPQLVAKYGLKYSPATIILSSLGTPLKLIVGPTSATKYAAQLRDARKKHDEMWRPRRPTRTPDRTGTERKVPPRPHATSCPIGCPSCAPAIRRALRWLATRQQPDGRWTKPKSERVTRTDTNKRLDRSIDHIDTALTALAGLALLAEGDGYDKQVERAKRLLVASIGDDGVVRADRTIGSLAVVYAHFETPLAAMFLAEAHARRPDPALKKKLALIARYLAAAQDERRGAWGYAPDFKEHPSLTRAGWRLLATTHCCLTALNHIRAAGVAVDEAAVKRATRYLLACRGKNGAFVYRPADKRLDGTPGQTAGALYALMRSGAAPSERLEPSWARYRRHYRRLDAFGEHESFFLLFTGLAMNARNAGAARDFHHSFRDVLLHDQQGDGHWKDPDNKGGSVMATAIGAIALQLPKGNLKLGAGRSPTPVVPKLDTRSYLAVPHESSRVKVFERKGRYWIDLIVSLDRPADEAYVAALKMGIAGANARVFDVTDGQMSIHTVDIHLNKGAWKKADIMITKEFYDSDKNSYPWAHGMTRVSKVTDFVGNRARERRRIGHWIMFPPTGITWGDPRFQHVLAHELCHYLFGAQDEYHKLTGESFCACILGRRGVTELCTEKHHTDDRQDAACWTLAKRLYPKLEIPKEPDPGPWEPPLPVVRVHR
ncbi:MAG: hypothetical protein ACYTGZ_12195 [Planctomycetota bacterium]|jgi:hypothetical protein